MISGEFVEKGDTYDHPEFCITLICNQDGNVDVRSLEESKCRRRRFTRDSIRKRFFLGMPSGHTLNPSAIKTPYYNSALFQFA